jgi:hypothetical protein
MLMRSVTRIISLPVIPGRREAANPESITTKREIREASETPEGWIPGSRACARAPE